MSLVNGLKRLFGKRTVVVDAHELEALQRENAEAGIPGLERADTEFEQNMPSTINRLLPMWGSRDRKGKYWKSAQAGNAWDNTEAANLNMRYEESAWREEHLRDE